MTGPSDKNGIKGIYRGEGGRWQCLDCLNNGTAEDEADEGIQHYAGCPALPTSPKRYEVDEYTGEKYKVEARYTEEARRLFHRYADTPGSSERSFVVIIAPMLETIMELRQRDEAARSSIAPIDMLLFCPRCQLQHVDAPKGDWTNPPHATHTCQGCGLLWRPSNALTNGVAGLASDEARHVERFMATDPRAFAASATPAKTCRMQDGPPIPWALAEAIWQGYAQCGGSDQPLEVVDRRGGFGWDEVAHIWKRREAREAIEAALRRADDTGEKK